MLSNQVDNTLDQAQNVVRQMDNALREAPMHPQSVSYRNRIKQYDADIQRYRHSFLTSVPANGGTGLDANRFNDTYQRVDATNNRLMNTERKAYESEAIGTAILTDLHGQREKLEGIDGKLSSVDDTMDRTHGKLFRLGMRLLTDKVILIVIIIVEFLIIFFLVFFKWIAPLLELFGSG